MPTTEELEPGWHPYESADRPDHERFFDGTEWTDRWVRRTTLQPHSPPAMSRPNRAVLAFILTGAAVAAGVVIFAGHGHTRTSEAPPVPIANTR